MFPRRTMVVYSAHPDSMLVQIRQIRPTISGLELSISKTKERGKRRGQGLARSWVKRCRLLLFLEDWNQWYARGGFHYGVFGYHAGVGGRDGVRVRNDGQGATSGRRIGSEFGCRSGSQRRQIADHHLWSPS